MHKSIKSDAEILRVILLLWYLKISVVYHVWFCKSYTFFIAAFISNFLLLMAV